MIVIDPVVQSAKILELQEAVSKQSKNINKLIEFMQAQARLNALASNRFDNIESILELIRKLRELDKEEE